MGRYYTLCSIVAAAIRHPGRKNAVGTVDARPPTVGLAKGLVQQGHWPSMTLSPNSKNSTNCVPYMCSTSPLKQKGTVFTFVLIQVGTQLLYCTSTCVYLRLKVLSHENFLYVVWF